MSTIINNARRATPAILAAIALLLAAPATAQNNANSPYSRYGYGQLADQSSAQGHAMGGLGFALPSNKQINPMNPASYAHTDSLTFLFDLAVSAQIGWLDDGTNKERHRNANIHSLNLLFPIHRRIAVSAGILPYSFVGYNFTEDNVDSDSIPYTQQYIGRGGLTELYAGIAVDLWPNRLSAGINIAYLFGYLQHYQSAAIDASTGYSRNQTLDIDDIKTSFGLLYSQPIDHNKSLLFGFSFSPKKQLHASNTDIITNTNSNFGNDTTLNNSLACDIPNSFGAGIAFIRHNRLTLAADVLFEDWKNARFFDEHNQFRNRLRLALGAEYIPNHQAKLIFRKIRYRAGLYLANEYILINNHAVSERGASIGIGLPLVDNRSFINLAFQYIDILPQTSLIRERYIRLAINYTFNERWFLKFKVD